MVGRNGRTGVTAIRQHPHGAHRGTPILPVPSFPPVLPSLPLPPFLPVSPVLPFPPLQPFLT
jgi:hypothetical protein